jgi:hypothetical protein
MASEIWMAWCSCLLAEPASRPIHKLPPDHNMTRPTPTIRRVPAVSGCVASLLGCMKVSPFIQVSKAIAPQNSLHELTGSQPSPRSTP